jgi:hypothetical protein
MIPKIIHYCWLSNDPFPKVIADCISSWKMHLPDYKFVLWDTNKFNLEDNIWVKQAFETKKYAFAADYIRLYAVYNYGGIYMDTDVEVKKSFNDLLHLPYIIGTEGDGIIEAGVFGAEKNADWLHDCLSYYDGKTFINNDGSFNTVTLPKIMMQQVQRKREIVVLPKSEVIAAHQLETSKNKLFLFPKEYFCAKNLGTGVLENTSETYSIHHFAMSWIPLKHKFLADFKRKLMRIFGVNTINSFIGFFNLKKVKDTFRK